MKSQVGARARENGCQISVSRQIAMLHAVSIPLSHVRERSRPLDQVEVNMEGERRQDQTGGVAV